MSREQNQKRVNHRSARERNFVSFAILFLIRYFCHTIMRLRSRTRYRYGDPPERRSETIHCNDID